MTAPLRRAVFLDRDGVLNRTVLQHGHAGPPRTLAELEIPTEVPGALAALTAAGFLLVGVSNQPDVRRGTQRREAVERINAALLAALPGLVEILVCYHDDGDGCGCRKPQPGLLLNAAVRLGIELASSFMIGDRWKDIEAGRQAGCRTVWLDSRGPEPAPDPPANHTVCSLKEAAEWILANRGWPAGTRT